MRSVRKQATGLVVLMLGGFWAAPAQDAAQETDAATAPSREIAIRDVVVIGSVGRYGRSAVHTDAVEAQLITREWSPPVAGQTLELPDGSSRTWEAVSADEEGWIEHKSLRGGYAYAAVESERDQAMLLEASGHSRVYVNGELRTGDPYRTGFVRLPVLLKAGTNHLLFLCGRGRFRAKLTEPKSPVALDLGDATLPDLIVGEKPNVWAAVVVLNATGEPLRDAQLVARLGDESRTTPLPPVPAWGMRKVGFQIGGAPPTETGKPEPRPSESGKQVELVLARGATELDRATIELRVRQPNESRKRTFISEIDGSVQYYAVQPARPEGDSEEPPALFLTLHGASVQALGQANCYDNKSWGHVVAPTNRRPFGFDWEDWGRIDTLEVLALAEQSLGTDPLRTYLTGHSMGGHGVWHVGVTYPDRFAAIAPSAAWISFWSYTGAQGFEDATPIEEILHRATNPSDTLALSRNYLHYGIYILHGGNDQEVPIKEAHTMREHLAEYHADFAYYERPGVKHWWGKACVDWPPLFSFLKHHTRPATHEVRDVEFVTANPAISATCHWATIEQQVHSLKLSKIDVHIDQEARLIHGTTENVQRLTIALKVDDPRRGNEPHFILEPNEPLNIELDGGRLENVEWPGSGDQLRLVRREEQWQPVEARFGGLESSWEKGPHRAGPFKEAFRNRVQFVYGTGGTPEENAWAFAKARYDAETFWYRGNGSIDVLADTEFRPDDEPDRGVILYGNADTNAAWKKLLPRHPVHVARGQVQVGEREIKGDDLAVLATYPRPGSERALVGVVSGTGPVGMRLTERLPYFVSGIAYPDWIVLGSETLREGSGGVRGAGFFGNDWQIDAAQSAWSER